MSSKRVHALILAGGKGTRLKPYTTFVPKPLMPMGDLPIIEVVLKQLKRFHLTEVTIAVGHMGKLIEAFVGDGERWGLNIDYVYENTPLGTAGPLRALKNREADAFLTLNGDLLTTLDFRKAIDHHFEHKSAATICLNRRSVPVDFGVVETTADGLLKEYQEKPVLSYTVSMGINIFSPQALDLIPEGRMYHAPDLLLELKKQGQAVRCFESPCFWLDIGRIEDYSQACESFEDLRKELLPDG